MNWFNVARNIKRIVSGLTQGLVNIGSTDSVLVLSLRKLQTRIIILNEVGLNHLLE